MPRVLYTAFDLVPSPKGAGTHIMHFLRGLVKAGYDVQLMTPGDGQLPASDAYEGARVIRVPPPPDRNFLAHAIQFSDAVMAHVAGAPPYDVVHYRSIWSGLALAQHKTRFGYQTLFEVNGLPSIELKYHYPSLRAAICWSKVREQELATLALSDAVICPSDVTRAYLASLGAPRERITVIPNGVSPRILRPPPLPAGRRSHPRPSCTSARWPTGRGWQPADRGHAADRWRSSPAQLRIVGRGRQRQRKALAEAVRKLGLETSRHRRARRCRTTEVPAVIAASRCVRRAAGL